jgi:hypothetical protein
MLSIYEFLGVCFLPPGLALLLFCISVYFSRQRNVHWKEYCPRCGRTPPVLDRRIRCSQCGCEYDLWGNILYDPPPQLRWDEFDLARFAAKPKPQAPDIEQEPTP